MEINFCYSFFHIVTINKQSYVLQRWKQNCDLQYWHCCLILCLTLAGGDKISRRLRRHLELRGAWQKKSIKIMGMCVLKLGRIAG
jgi:hypothetical protein